MAEKSLPNPSVTLPPLACPGSTSPAAGTGTGVMGPKAEEMEGLAVMEGRRVMEEEEEEGRREVAEGVAGSVADEMEEAEKEGGMGWTDATGADKGVFPLREGGTMLGASSVGSSLPRTFSAMRCMARANCSAFSLPSFRVSHRFL